MTWQASRFERLETEIPPVGLGTWQLTGDRCRQTVSLAFEIGYRFIDTAQGYGNEAEVGAAIEESGLERGDLFVTTKVWPDHLVEDAGTVDLSLERLGVDRVDLLLLHWPSPTLPVERTVEALLPALESGKARFVGVSNFPPRLLMQARARAPIFNNQIELHPYLSQDRLVSLCRRLDVAVTAYCPLAHGKVAEDPVLLAIGRRYDKSAAQVAMRWLIQKKGVTAVAKASGGVHLHENLDIFDFELSDEEVQRVGSLNCGERIIDPDFARDWHH